MTRDQLRQRILLGTLAVTIAASLWASRDDAPDLEVAAPIERPTNDSGVNKPGSETTANNQVAPSEIRLDLARLTQRELAGTDIDPFRTKSWYVAPPPPPPEPPPKPTAPPLPFQFVGKTEEPGSGKPAVYLSAGSEFYTVAIGDKFAANYKLERIEHGALVIRYLPLSIIQTLSIGSSD